MSKTKDTVIEELFEHVEAAAEHFAPALGSYAVAALPIVKKGIKWLIKLVKEKSHEDAERILDRLLEEPAARLEDKL